MSILIKGMEIPTSCWSCACYHHKVDDGYYDYDVCQASGTVFNDGYASVTGHEDRIDPFKQRLDNCPLAPVPPHGRLIDADVMQKEWFNLNFDRKITDGTLAYWNFQLSKIPTIIEAEEGET